jgi:hypothetical protein
VHAHVPLQLAEACLEVRQQLNSVHFLSDCIRLILVVFINTMIVGYWLISVVRSDHFLQSDLFSCKFDLICVWYAPTPTTMASDT